MSLEIRALREEERDECIQLWRLVFEGENNKEYFRRYFYGDVEWLPYYTTVAVLDGRLVSAVHIVKRVVACGEFRLTMGGIANVATLSEFRGQGFNKLCLERAISVMEADAMDFSLLYTGIPDYYAKFGYATLSQPVLTGTIRPDLKPNATEYAVRPAVGKDLPAIRALYDAYNISRPIAVQRTEAYWRDWLGIAPNKVPDTLFVVTDSGGKVVGYARTAPVNAWMFSGSEDMEGFVSEWAISPDLPDAAQLKAATALLHEIAAGCLAFGANKIRIEAGIDSTLLGAAQTVLEEQDLTGNTSGMVRLLHRDNLLRSLTPLLNERWISINRPRVAVTFDTPYGPVRLDTTGSFLRVETTDETPNLISQANFLGMLFGFQSPEGSTLNMRIAYLLATLFPAQAGVYWNADGF